MLKSINTLTTTMQTQLIKLLSPHNISLQWNLGSFLGMILSIQTITGILLTFTYSPGPAISFFSIEYLSRMVNYGVILRWLHLNLASLFFLIIYLHLFRGMYYGLTSNKDTWTIGVSIILILMITAFVGYVLPWNQMSYWAATVITKFITVIPIIGMKTVQIVWSGFSINDLTLKLFFSLHFILPAALMILVILHLIALHFHGSHTPILTTTPHKIKFTPSFLSKDAMNMVMMLTPFLLLNLWMTFESENFIMADYLVSPIHIKPEWYFLFAYAILRSIPQKLTGVFLMIMSVTSFYLLTCPPLKYTSAQSKPINLLLISTFTLNFLFLSWVGGNPVTDLFTLLGQLSGTLYFTLLLSTLIHSMMNKYTMY